MQNPSRRKFLVASSLAGMATAAGLSAEDDEEIATGLIDAHVHVWNADREKYPISPNFGAKEVSPPIFSPDVLLGEQKDTGVSRTVLIQMSFFEFDNSYMLDAIASMPGRFRGVAIIDYEREGAKDLMSDLYGKGVRGFRLYAFADRVKGWDDSDGFQAMWKAGADTKQAMCCLTDPDALSAVRKMVEKYPDTQVVIDHFARVGMSGTVDQQQLDQLLALADFPNVAVKTSAFYALGKKKPPYTDLAPMIRQMRDAYGSKRLMWGSDCPYQVQGEHSYKASLALVQDYLDFLSEEEKMDILRDTADRLFFS